MSKEHIENSVEKIVQDIVTGSVVELVDVEYVKEREWYLRVFLDKEGGIEIEDCQWVSEKVEAKLEELNLIKDRYYLEVSSPGIDRPLKKDKDFEKAYGKKVDMMFFSPWNGNKTLEAVLVSHDDTKITVLVNNENVEIERKLIANIRPHIEF